MTELRTQNQFIEFCKDILSQHPNPWDAQIESFAASIRGPMHSSVVDGLDLVNWSWMDFNTLYLVYNKSGHIYIAYRTDDWVFQRDNPAESFWWVHIGRESGGHLHRDREITRGIGIWPSFGQRNVWVVGYEKLKMKKGMGWLNWTEDPFEEVKG